MVLGLEGEVQDPNPTRRRLTFAVPPAGGGGMKYTFHSGVTCQIQCQVWLPPVWPEPDYLTEGGSTTRCIKPVRGEMQRDMIPMIPRKVLGAG